jgi:uncharacterized membrane protein YphA (DoxX/SURF4 family)
MSMNQSLFSERGRMRRGALDRWLSALLRPSLADPARATVLVRAAVGFVFVVSGTIKFLFENQGPGRFARIGLAPELAHFVGAVEVVAGSMVLAGLLTRLAAIPLVIDMVVAIATTKLPLLTGPGPEPVAAMPKTGFWALAYQARLDLAMLLTCAYFAAAGAGLLSFDAWLARARSQWRLVAKARAQE